MKKPIVLITLSLLSLWLWPRVAHSDGIVQCSSMDNTSGPKVVLSKFAYELADSSRGTLSDKIEYQMDVRLGMLTTLNTRLGSHVAQPVLCKERFPAIDASDFKPEYVGALWRDEVLMEMWGQVKEEKTDDSSTFSAYIFVIIIPARYQDPDGPADFHTVVIPSDTGSSLIEAFNRMAFGTEFQVYACIAQGLTEFGETNYESAIAHISDARALWEAAMSDSSLAYVDPSADQLLEYLTTLETEILDSAGDSTLVARVNAALEELEDPE